ncbi:MAG: hypothetical protein H5T43_10925 [Methanomethylovorans sp.]|nr:hypothetical protein [Methanomethylovorans sp.]
MLVIITTALACWSISCVSEKTTYGNEKVNLAELIDESGTEYLQIPNPKNIYESNVLVKQNGLIYPLADPIDEYISEELKVVKSTDTETDTEDLSSASVEYAELDVKLTATDVIDQDLLSHPVETEPVMLGSSVGIMILLIILIIGYICVINK